MGRKQRKSTLFAKDHKCPVSAAVKRPTVCSAGGREGEPDLSDVSGGRVERTRGGVPEQLGTSGREASLSHPQRDEGARPHGAGRKCLCQLHPQAADLASIRQQAWTSFGTS